MKVKCQVVASSFLLFAALSAAGASLREAYAPHFNVGVALGRNEVADPASRALAAREFSSATVENVMKPCVVQPREGVFRWDAADDFVSFAEKSGMKVIGHCLVWHSQTAAWMFEGPDGKPASRELMIERMRKHIHAVVGRYKGRVKGWDVVNEAIEGDGSYRKSRWLEQVGGDYIALAFKFAHEADPDAELYYNDYGMASRGKREAVVRLVRDLKAKGLRIDGVGMQSHVSLKDPNLCEYEKSLAAFAAEGVKVCVTELDVSVLPSAWGQSADISATHEGGEKFNPWKDGKLPTEMQEKLAARYRDLFEIYLRHAKDIDRVTFWGLTDKQSWLNDFPVKGRIDYPLLFDREGRAKPCYDALLALPGRPRSANACPAAGSNVVKTALFTKFAYAGRGELEPCDLKKQYRNPIVAGMGPDPAITKKDGDFYLAQSSFSYFPGIPVYHSKDLVNWDFCGYVGNRTTNLKFPSGLDLSAGVFAPDIKYNPYNDTFYLIVTVIGDRGNVVYKTKDPYLGWSEPIPVPVGGIDPSFYFEDDKTAWILNNDDAPDGKAEYSGHRTVRMRKYDLLADKCVPGTERIIINKGVHPEEKPIWCEGPHLYKIDGRYWVMTAEGGTASEHSEVMWVSENVEGPYKPCKINPILTQRDLPGDRPNPVTAAGHADLFQTRDGGWMAVFLGIEPYERGHGERGTGNATRPTPGAARSSCPSSGLARGRTASRSSFRRARSFRASSTSVRGRLPTRRSRGFSFPATSNTRTIFHRQSSTMVGSRFARRIRRGRGALSRDSPGLFSTVAANRFPSAVRPRSSRAGCAATASTLRFRSISNRRRRTSLRDSATTRTSSITTKSGRPSLAARRSSRFARRTVARRKLSRRNRLRRVRSASALSRAARMFRLNTQRRAARGARLAAYRTRRSSRPTMRAASSRRRWVPSPRANKKEAFR